jgi:5'-phosphate synthase pdxT subunit
VTIGVLALQGDVAEHLRAITAAGAHPVPVRRCRTVRGRRAHYSGRRITTIWKLATYSTWSRAAQRRIRAECRFSDPARG